MSESCCECGAGCRRNKPETGVSKRSLEPGATRRRDRWHVGGRDRWCRCCVAERIVCARQVAVYLSMAFIRYGSHTGGLGPLTRMALDGPSRMQVVPFGLCWPRLVTGRPDRGCPTNGRPSPQTQAASSQTRRRDTRWEKRLELRQVAVGHFWGHSFQPTSETQPTVLLCGWKSRHSFVQLTDLP